MSSKRALEKETASSELRSEPRVHGLRQISVLYEGRKEQIVVKPPDLSTHGMFISINRIFPEGAVLNLRFQLAHSGVEVETRGEVRYCLPGVGVGVEFVGLLPEAEHEIALEVACLTREQHRPTRKLRHASKSALKRRRAD
jgi:PilZ domain